MTGRGRSAAEVEESRAYVRRLVDASPPFNDRQKELIQRLWGPALRAATEARLKREGAAREGGASRATK